MRPFDRLFTIRTLFMTAGYLAGQISSSTWETPPRARILDPLGMSESTFSIGAMEKTGHYARPYAGGRDTITAIDYHRVDAIGPSGSINSSVSTMVPWIQLILNEGRHEDTQLVDSTTITELTRPRAALRNSFPYLRKTSPSLLYALGWFVEPYGETRLL